MTKKTFKSVTVYGFQYENVTANLDNDGQVVDGYIPGVGKFYNDSLVAMVLRGELPTKCGRINESES